jgi:hypothetical protein
VPTSFSYDELEAANARFETAPEGAWWRAAESREFARAGAISESLGGIYSNRVLFSHLNACGYLISALLSLCTFFS